MPPTRRTSIAARASSRWTESDRAALERARTRVHARDVAEGANSRLATSRDRTDGASPSSRAPKIFRHTVREAFGEWLPAISRDALSRARENVPPANATRDVSRSRSGPPATTAPDVSVATLAKVRAWVRAWRAKTKASVSTRLVGGEGRDVEKNSKKTDSVFVSTNARALRRASARIRSARLALGTRATSRGARTWRSGGPSVPCDRPTRTKPGTSRRKPVDGSPRARRGASSSRRKRKRTENKRGAPRLFSVQRVTTRFSFER